MDERIKLQYYGIIAKLVANEKSEKQQYTEMYEGFLKIVEEVVNEIQAKEKHMIEAEYGLK